MTSRGRTKPTGPFTNVARPIEPNKAIFAHKRRSPAPPGDWLDANQKETRAAVNRNVSVISKITWRAKVITRGQVAQTMEASKTLRLPELRSPDPPVCAGTSGN